MRKVRVINTNWIIIFIWSRNQHMGILVNVIPGWLLNEINGLLKTIILAVNVRQDIVKKLWQTMIISELHSQRWEEMSTSHFVQPCCSNRATYSQ